MSQFQTNKDIGASYNIDTGLYSQEQLNALGQNVLGQIQSISWNNLAQQQYQLADYGPLVRQIWDIMKWQCTQCKKDLEIAKKGKMNHLKVPGMVILECNHCGFEFMTKALTEEDQILDKKSQKRIYMDLDHLKKKVKNFQLR